MSRLSGLNPERVIRAFIRAGWKEAGQVGWCVVVNYEKFKGPVGKI